MAYHDVMS